ncbi:adenosylcobinamide-phosphate synthase CbiB [Natronomonas aquatica]|uniref:adenosylcobinamide-phosphate synthase CbiB n=1 Tax=Natronomonas aquatica TaxID=2841590 RepID=UPI0021087743
MIAPGPAVVVAVAVAGGLETAVGEPPGRYHPVAFLGGLIGRLEARKFGVPRFAGAFYAVSVPLGSAIVVYGLVWSAGAVHSIAAAVLSGVVLWVASSLRMLLGSARSVIEASDDDTDAAREALPALVGRDTGGLSPELVRSAAIESLAENLSDGLIAPLSAFLALSFVSIPAAAAAAAFLKATNTMDSMLGYPGPLGWGSARLDDLFMLLPARITAVLISLSAGDPDAPLRARRYAYKPASPNAGWPMGTLAAVLDVRLEKPGAYVLNDVAAGPTERDGYAAIALTKRAGGIAYLLAAIAGVFRWL